MSALEYVHPYVHVSLFSGDGGAAVSIMLTRSMVVSAGAPLCYISAGPRAGGGGTKSDLRRINPRHGELTLGPRLIFLRNQGLAECGIYSRYTSGAQRNCIPARSRHIEGTEGE